jgi:hypothetical protein
MNGSPAPDDRGPEEGPPIGAKRGIRPSGRPRKARTAVALAVGALGLVGLAARTEALTAEPGGPPAAPGGGPALALPDSGPTSAASIVDGPVAGPPAPGTTTGPAAVPGDAATPVLRGDGLGVVTLGDDADRAVPILVRTFGVPGFDSGWSGGLRSLNFGLLNVELRDAGGTRTVAGAYYTLPDGVGPITAPRLDTARPLGLATDEPVPFARFAASGPPVASDPDHPGAPCVAAPGGRLCAYTETPADGRGGGLRPAPDARLVAVMIGHIRPFGHCLL